MTRRIVLMLMAAAVSGAGHPTRVGQAVPNVNDRFHRFDHNGDGKLTADELPRPGLLQRLDVDGDGMVTPDEVKQWRATRPAAASEPAPAGKPLTTVKGVIALDTQAYDVPQFMRATSSQMYRTVFGEDEATQRDASPMHHIADGQGIAPFLVCYSHGMGVRRNPQRAAAATAFAEALKAAGVQADVVDASDRNHGEMNARFGDPADDNVTGKAMAFLNGILRKGK